jgi:acetylornithine deacetylase
MITDIKKLSEDAVNLLKEMIAIPSPSFGEEEVCAYISQWLSDRNIVHERLGNNIIAESWKQEGAEYNEGQKTLMLCAHIDTVSASPDYSFDPHKPYYGKAAEVISEKTGMQLGEEDVVAGLGSNDDGASVVSMIAAFRYYFGMGPGSRGCKNRATPLAAGGGAQASLGGVVLVLSCEEERSGKDGMTGLWGSRLCARGEGKSGCTEVDYAIVGEPTCMKAATAERGLLVIDGHAHGISGHAARNEGENALYKAMEDILRLRTHEFSRLSPRMGKVNLNVTQINAGTAHNVIPDNCSFVIDIRPTEQYDNAEILAELQGICTSELKARNLANRSSATFEDSPLQKAAETLGIETFSSPTTSDWMRITCDTIKMGPGDSSRSHRKNEFVTTDEISTAIEEYIKFISLV